MGGSRLDAPGMDGSAPVKAVRGGWVGPGVISAFSLISKGFWRMDLSPRANVGRGAKSERRDGIPNPPCHPYRIGCCDKRGVFMICAVSWDGKHILKLDGNVLNMIQSFSGEGDFQDTG